MYVLGGVVFVDMNWVSLFASAWLFQVSFHGLGRFDVPNNEIYYSCQRYTPHCAVNLCKWTVPGSALIF